MMLMVKGELIPLNHELLSIFVACDVVHKKFQQVISNIMRHEDPDDVRIIDKGRVQAAIAANKSSLDETTRIKCLLEAARIK